MSLYEVILRRIHNLGNLKGVQLQPLQIACVVDTAAQNHFIPLHINYTPINNYKSPFHFVSYCKPLSRHFGEYLNTYFEKKYSREPLMGPVEAI